MLVKIIYYFIPYKSANKYYSFESRSQLFIVGHFKHFKVYAYKICVYIFNYYIFN